MPYVKDIFVRLCDLRVGDSYLYGGNPFMILDILPRKLRVLVLDDRIGVKTYLATRNPEPVCQILWVDDDDVL